MRSRKAGVYGPFLPYGRRGKSDEDEEPAPSPNPAATPKNASMSHQNGTASATTTTTTTSTNGPETFIGPKLPNEEEVKAMPFFERFIGFVSNKPAAPFEYAEMGKTVTNAGLTGTNDRLNESSTGSEASDANSMSVGTNFALPAIVDSNALNYTMYCRKGSKGKYERSPGGEKLHFKENGEVKFTATPIDTELQTEQIWGSWKYTAIRRHQFKIVFTKLPYVEASINPSGNKITITQIKKESSVPQPPGSLGESTIKSALHTSFDKTLEQKAMSDRAVSFKRVRADPVVMMTPQSNEAKEQPSILASSHDPKEATAHEHSLVVVPDAIKSLFHDLIKPTTEDDEEKSPAPNGSTPVFPEDKTEQQGSQDSKVPAADLAATPPTPSGTLKPNVSPQRKVEFGTSATEKDAAPVPPCGSIAEPSKEPMRSTTTSVQYEFFLDTPVFALQGMSDQACIDKLQKLQRVGVESVVIDAKGDGIVRFAPLKKEERFNKEGQDIARDSLASKLAELMATGAAKKADGRPHWQPVALKMLPFIPNPAVHVVCFVGLPAGITTTVLTDDHIKTALASHLPEECETVNLRLVVDSRVTEIEDESLQEGVIVSGQVQRLIIDFSRARDLERIGHRVGSGNQLVREVVFRCLKLASIGERFCYNSKILAVRLIGACRALKGAGMYFCGSEKTASSLHWTPFHELESVEQFETLKGIFTQGDIVEMINVQTEDGLSPMDLCIQRRCFYVAMALAKGTDRYYCKAIPSQGLYDGTYALLLTALKELHAATDEHNFLESTTRDSNAPVVAKTTKDVPGMPASNKAASGEDLDETETTTESAKKPAKVAVVNTADIASARENDKTSAQQLVLELEKGKNADVVYAECSLHLPWRVHASMCFFWMFLICFIGDTYLFNIPTSKLLPDASNIWSMSNCIRHTYWGWDEVYYSVCGQLYVRDYALIAIGARMEIVENALIGISPYANDTLLMQPLWNKAAQIRSHVNQITSWGVGPYGPNDNTTAFQTIVNRTKDIVTDLRALQASVESIRSKILRSVTANGTLSPHSTIKLTDSSAIQLSNAFAATTTAIGLVSTIAGYLYVPPFSCPSVFITKLVFRTQSSGKFTKLDYYYDDPAMLRYKNRNDVTLHAIHYSRKASLHVWPKQTREFHIASEYVLDFDRTGENHCALLQSANLKEWAECVDRIRSIRIIGLGGNLFRSRLIPTGPWISWRVSMWSVTLGVFLMINLIWLCYEHMHFFITLLEYGRNISLFNSYFILCVSALTFILPSAYLYPVATRGDFRTYRLALAVFIVICIAFVLTYIILFGARCILPKESRNILLISPSFSEDITPKLLTIFIQSVAIATVAFGILSPAYHLFTNQVLDTNLCDFDNCAKTFYRLSTVNKFSIVITAIPGFLFTKWVPTQKWFLAGNVLVLAMASLFVAVEISSPGAQIENFVNFTGWFSLSVILSSSSFMPMSMLVGSGLFRKFGANETVDTEMRQSYVASLAMAEFEIRDRKRMKKVIANGDDFASTGVSGEEFTWTRLHATFCHICFLGACIAVFVSPMLTPAVYPYLPDRDPVTKILGGLT